MARFHQRHAADGNKWLSIPAAYRWSRSDFDAAVTPFSSSLQWAFEKTRGPSLIAARLVSGRCDAIRARLTGVPTHGLVGSHSFRISNVCHRAKPALDKNFARCSQLQPPFPRGCMPTSTSWAQPKSVAKRNFARKSELLLHQILAGACG